MTVIGRALRELATIFDNLFYGFKRIKVPDPRKPASWS